MRGLRRLIRKNKPADPFARFTETYGVRTAPTGAEEAPFENGYHRAENASGRSSSKERDEERRSSEILEREDSLSTARRTLEVAKGMGAKEVITAYRKLARTHHPDKVANLKAEVREYSEQRMKEINAAYTLLRRQRDDSASLSRGRVR